jgi:putative ABC transport system permease protein
MPLLPSLRVALRALIVHKGRSLLTSLGVIIGVGAVIAMVSAGDGVGRKLDDRMESVGKNMIIVQPGTHVRSGAVSDAAPLTRDDAALIRKQVGPLLVGVAEAQLTSREAATSTTLWHTLVTGSVPDLEIVREWKMASGRFFTAEETARDADVCLLGETVRKKLFPNDPSPLGQVVRVDKLQLHVVGLLAPKGFDPAGNDQDDEILVPITTLQHKLVGEEKLNVILASVRGEGLMPRALEEITRAMRQAHHIKDGPDDFNVRSVREMAELAYFIANTVQGLVAVIASLSLLVGGIGIMNIMLVSVTERTREIGLRMAVGATSGHILAQFLIEAVFLSLLGGTVGVLTGLAAGAALAWAFEWPMVISPLVVLAAVGVSAAVGVFFGYYPAWKAARLDPIIALRYE